MNSILEVVNNSVIENPAEAFFFGGKILLLGIGTVFLVLALIWGSIEIFRFVFNRISNKSNGTLPSADKITVTPAPAHRDNTQEIVAVIAAAIAMAESENPGFKFKVVSFKRK